MATRSLQRPARKTSSNKKSKARVGGPTSGQQLHSVGQRAPGDSNGALSQEEQLACGLGWFGIGLGLVELMTPVRLARATGLPPRHYPLIRIMGLREIGSGLGIVMQHRPAAAVWSRVAGDVIDLICLGAAFTSPRANRKKLAAAVTAVAGAAALDLLCAQQLTRGIETRHSRTPVTASLTVDRSPEDLYTFWRDFSKFPSFMKHVRSVEMTGDRRSHWVVTAPAGFTVKWDAEITEDQPNKLIAWRTVEGAEVDHAGHVRFEPAPGGRGTMITVDMQYRAPAGMLGSAVAGWFGQDPSQSIKMDLRRFKQVMETGEVVTTEGQPAGRSSSTSLLYDAATRR